MNYEGVQWEREQFSGLRTEQDVLEEGRNRDGLAEVEHI